MSAIRTASLLTSLLLTPPLWAQAANTAAVEPAPKPAEKRCEPLTGSRIAAPPDAQGHCQTKSPGLQSFSSDELFATGRIDPAEALQVLNPALGFGSGLPGL